MGIETNPIYPNDLNPSYPLDSDMAEQGAAHLRNLKTVMRNLYRDADGVMLAPGDVNYGGTIDSIYFPGSILLLPGKTTSDPTPPVPSESIGGNWAVVGYIPISLTSNDGLGAVPTYDGLKELRVFYRFS